MFSSQPTRCLSVNLILSLVVILLIREVSVWGQRTGDHVTLGFISLSPSALFIMISVFTDLP